MSFEPESRESPLETALFTYKESSDPCTIEARVGKGAHVISSDGGKLVAVQGAREKFSGAVRKMTIAAWVRMSEKTSFTLFWRIPGSTSSPGFFQLVYSGYQTLVLIAVGSDGGARSATSPVTVIVPDDWTHLAMTFDEGAVRFYVNGQQTGPDVYLPDELPESPNADVSFAGFVESQAKLQIDDYVVMMNAALGAEDIYDVFENGFSHFFSKSNQ